MSFDPELATEAAGGSSHSGEHGHSHASPTRESVRGMGYDEGAAALSPGQRAASEPSPAPPAALPGDVVPAPADLDRERPVGGAVPADIRSRLMTHIRRSARTVTLLDDIAAHGGAAFDLVWARQGTGHVTGKIQLDRRWRYGMWVPSMAHELSHLNDFRQGRRPEVGSSANRATFVATKVGNEVNAHATQYAAHWELGQAGHSPGYQPAGYSEFMTHLNGLGGTVNAASVESQGRTWLTAEYRTNPLFTTSNTTENYYDYWGRIWDEAHPS